MDKKHRNKIILMTKNDQLCLMTEGCDITKLCAKHARILKDIVKEFGWPELSTDGTKVVDGAWLIAQHADYDVKFQKHCLKLLRNKVKLQQVPLWHVAYLTDRILVNEGKPQVYGTQFYSDSSGFYGPRPVKDKNNLDKRRAKMGLEKFKVYESRIKELNSRATVRTAGE